MSAPPEPACVVCAKVKSATTKLSHCGRCRSRLYCGTDCQTSDWSTHKKLCLDPNKPWYDRYRKCQDGSKHEGKLELITWHCPEEETGWGHVSEDEADEVREKFEKELGGDEKKLYDYWPQAFRWTCCGTDAGMDYGCDHHGTGSKPCTCDFCKMGEPLPDAVYNEPKASRMGLKLERGPDRRSYNPKVAPATRLGRSMVGMPM